MKISDTSRRRRLSLGASLLAATALVLGATSTTASALTQSTSSQATPAPPTGLSPAAGAAVSAIPTLSWNRVAGPSSTLYNVQVSTSSTYDSSKLLWSTTTVNLAAVPNVQLPNGAIYWRVQTVQNGVQSDWATSSFLRSATAPPTPETPSNDPSGQHPLQEPQDVAHFTWTNVQGALRYNVEIGTDPAFTDASSYSTYQAPSTTFVLQNAQPAGTYYWRVQAQLSSDGITTDWSDPSSYVTTGLAAVTPVSPVDDNAVTDVALHWKPVLGAAGYDVQVSTDQNFSSILDSQRVLGTTYSPPTTYNNDQYFWRVRGVDANGYSNNWSTATISTFQRNWPDQPKLTYPASGATVGGQFYYQWQGVPHASSYRVDLSTSRNFAPSATTSCTTVNTTLVPSTCLGVLPAPDTTYWWRVQGTDSGSGAVTDVIGFTPQSFVYSPGTVHQTSPADGASPQVPTMSWQAVTNAASYLLNVTDTATNTTTTYPTYSTQFTPRTRLTSGDTYRWSVQWVDANGKPSSASAATKRTFTVPAPDAGTAATPDPTDSGVVSYTFPTLTWKAVANADHYVVTTVPDGSSSPTFQMTSQYPATEDDSNNHLNPGTYDFTVEAFDKNGTSLGTSSSTGYYGIAAPDGDGLVNGYQVGATGTTTYGDAGQTQQVCGRSLPDNCTNLSQTPVLSWTPTPGATSYHLYLSHDAELTNIYFDAYVKGAAAWTDLNALADSQAGNAYYWEVTPCTAAGCLGLVHATHAFNKLGVSPTPTGDVDELGNSNPAQNDITLSWKSLLASAADDSTTNRSVTTPSTTDALDYQVQTATDSAFNHLVDDITVDQTSFTSYAHTLPEGPVYWRVRAYDGSSNPLPWSATQSFTKTSPSPTLDTPETPGAEFSWQPLLFAKNYDVEVYKNDDMVPSSGNRVLQFTTSQIEYTPGTALPSSATPYTWRVRSSDAEGRKDPWSALKEFTVTGSVGTLDQPAPNATISPRSQTFTWSAVPGASHYIWSLTRNGDSNPTVTANTPATAWAPTNTLGAGGYTWTVTAYDSVGQVVSTDATRTLTVQSAPVATTAPHIQGGTSSGSKITITPGTPVWSPSVDSDSYQWMRDGNPIAGATDASYTLTDADVNHQITLVDTGHLGGYDDGTTTSNVLGATSGTTLTTTTRPSISGTPSPGHVLTVDPGTWNANPQPSFTYQWYRSGTAISGATAQTYTVSPLDAGHALAVRITASETGYQSGYADTDAVSVPKYVSRSTISAPATAHVRKAFTVSGTVSISGVGNPPGTVRVYDGSKLLATVALTAKGGGRWKASVKLTTKGSHTLVARYTGNSGIAGSSATRKVTVKK